MFVTLYITCMRDFWHVNLRTKTQIRLSSTHIAVAQDKEWVLYDRQMPHRFALLPHDRAPMERLVHDFERQKASIARKAVFKKPYYGESFIVALEYLGQRNDLLTAYGRNEATAIVARLQACNEIIEARTRQGRGAAINPADQWGHQPGDIGEPTTLH